MNAHDVTQAQCYCRVNCFMNSIFYWGYLITAERSTLENLFKYQFKYKVKGEIVFMVVCFKRLSLIDFYATLCIDCHFLNITRRSQNWLHYIFTRL